MQVFLKRTSWMAAAGLAFYASGAQASQINWEMSVSPLVDTVAMTNVPGTGDGFGNGTTEVASPHFSGLQNGTNGPAGTARFVDSGSTGNNGMYRQTFGGDWSADLRINVEATTAGGGGRSIGIAYADGAGRAIAFTDGTGNGFTFRVVSSGTVNSANVPDNGGSDGFHMIRMVLHDDAGQNTLAVYDLENDTDAGPGYNWNLLLFDNVNMNGATGKPGSLSALAGGIMLNSESNSGTSSSKYLMDWLRVNNNTALTANDPIMVPEPATLAMLILGGVPMLIRRRRAA
jgi:hypothetical protein